MVAEETDRAKKIDKEKTVRRERKGEVGKEEGYRAKEREA